MPKRFFCDEWNSQSINIQYSEAQYPVCNASERFVSRTHKFHRDYHQPDHVCTYYIHLEISKHSKFFHQARFQLSI